ncbi:hypothetical protein QQ020_32275 [Fulvivirgaceae bacterium BMA12]|uniref:Uncharacterized protein n=1 Tax=Agaribacillus aureus TaxID=3051825 RepID=A0ABT8LG72_9BACT|nr:hypothetical protein [Fulvivirgaceae bacterium BMA12]
MLDFIEARKPTIHLSEGVMGLEGSIAEKPHRKIPGSPLEGAKALQMVICTFLSN